MPHMTIAQYAEHVGKDPRTIERWLAKSRLPDAVLTSTGWLIPSDAVPVGMPDARATAPAGTVARTTPSALTTPAAPAALPQGAGLSVFLETLPAYVPLEVAVQVLGITEQAIRRNAEELGAKPWGPRGTLVVPVRAVRDAAGLRPEA